MIKPRLLKSLALLSLTALFGNILYNTFHRTPINPHEYDLILNDISRRLSLVKEKQPTSKSRLSQIRSHHARKLIERGLDPHSTHFKKLLQERMARVNAVREARGGERKIRRGMEIGEEVWRGTPLVVDERESKRSLKQQNISMEPLNICSRPTNIAALSKFSFPPSTSCPASSSSKKSMLLLSGRETFGRTGNNLIEFLHALQVARDKELVLGIMQGSWAMQVLMGMFLAIESEEGWEKKWEEAFCAKIIKSEEELKGYNVLKMTTKELFGYSSPAPYDEYVASTQYSIRALFQNYNTGKGTGIRRNEQVKDMCSGIDAMFGDQKSKVLYSVIHSRHLEGAPGLRLLSKVCRHAKCDPKAALEMRPDYIKSILAPLNMLQHPIVLITDGQDFSVIQRLMADRDIGPMLRMVPEEATWIGGDTTLGIMSNVFIGNPASTFSTFIAKSRLSLGFGQNYLFRRKTAEGEWVTSCGDGCVFDKRVMDVMS